MYLPLIVFAARPPMSREQCGQVSGENLTGIFPGSLLLSIPEQRRLSYAQAVLGVSLYEPRPRTPSLPKPVTGVVARRQVPGPGAHSGVDERFKCYPHCWYELFKVQRRGTSPFAVLPKKL